MYLKVELLSFRNPAVAPRTLAAQNSTGCVSTAPRNPPAPSTIQKIGLKLRTTTVTVGNTLSQLNLVHITTSICKIHFNIILLYSHNLYAVSSNVEAE